VSSHPSPVIHHSKYISADKFFCNNMRFIRELEVVWRDLLNTLDVIEISLNIEKCVFLNLKCNGNPPTPT